MHTIETKEVFHTGWPDSDWIKGFQVVIKPLVELSFREVREVLMVSSLEGVDQHAARFYFPVQQLKFMGQETQLYAGRDDDSHYGKPGSPMHEIALTSLSTRVKFLLESSGVQL